MSVLTIGALPHKEVSRIQYKGLMLPAPCRSQPENTGALWFGLPAGSY
jgi:hypothetical protein